MTERVDFYVLKSAAPKQRFNFACRLTEKAYLRNLKVLVLAENAADAALLDEMLWTFSDRSFVPHDLRAAAGTAVAAGGAGSTPVQLTAELADGECADLLVNLAPRMPAPLNGFARVAEIIDADEERRARGRERYKAYRDLQLPVETHQLDDAAGD